jgi:hypothetical protein
MSSPAEIEAFLQFSPIFCEKIVFFLNQCYDVLFAEFSSVSRQKSQFFSPIFLGEDV